MQTILTKSNDFCSIGIFIFKQSLTHFKLKNRYIIMTRTVLQREFYGKSVPKTVVGNLAVTIEDYGSEKPLPHYGLNRPNADYFNSSIHHSNMNIIDPSGRGSSIFLYDE